MCLTYEKYSLFCFGILVSSSYRFLVAVRRGYSLFAYALLCSFFFVSAMLCIPCFSAQMATDEVSGK
jgi:hypothetical protein